MTRRRVLLIVLPTLAAIVAAALALAREDGRIGPARHLRPDGRLLRPQAALVKLGHFPIGGVATPDGRFLWTVSAGRALNDVRIVDVARRRVLQVLPVPGASGGIALDPPRHLAYVSGLHDSKDADEQHPKLPGRDGDTVHVFRYDARTGRAKEIGTIPVPPPSDAPVPQDFPPTNVGQKLSYPERLAVSPDGKRLLVPLNLADQAAVVDVSSKAVSYVKTGNYPYAAAVLPGGRTGLVTNETPGTLSVIDMATATKTKDIQVGDHLSHPEAIAIDRRRHRVYVALANSDRIAVVDTKSMALIGRVSVQRSQGIGVDPVGLALNPAGTRLYAAEAGGDELSVLELRGNHPPRLIGRIPTAAYPAAVAVTGGKRARLLWVAGKGFGAGPNPNGPNPFNTHDSNLLHHPGTAVLSPGYAGIQPIPDARHLRTLTRIADRQIRPSNGEKAPRGTPLRAGGPIKHVFYIVRENRTYDQVMGDDPRGDGDPALTIFGNRITPNAHALARRFPLLDHVYANSEASIDGHYWTAAGKVSDYVHRNWQQNYAGRERPYDFGVYEVSMPPGGYLFDQAEREGISWMNYGEAVANVIPLFPDKDRTPDDEATTTEKFAHSDVGRPTAGCYPNDAFIGKNAITQADTWDTPVPAGENQVPPPESRFTCFQQKFSQQVAAGNVPTFNYLVLPSDHTEGTSPGRRTPRAMVAENDDALGLMVDTISHSKIWGSSAIFVVEDDSQDGSDHVDAHRMPAFVISPYARRGAVVSRRYDMLSVIRSMELIMGMKPLGVFDALATPMYDAFSTRPANAAPFNALAPTYPINQRNTAASPMARVSSSYQISSHPDGIPQRVLDAILWRSVHGAHSTPPGPGPNAVPELPRQAGAPREGINSRAVGRAMLAAARRLP